MPKLKTPILSLKATGRLGKLLALARRQGRNIIERRPIPTDAKSPAQLFSRHMFSKCIDLWHLLSEAEQLAWESAARPRHMTGYAWYISQCLRPNPGIYLPLQGGTMSGDISMAKNKLEKLPAPIGGQDADTKAARDAAIAAALADCIDSHIHAWDGSNWQKLLVESAAQHNLRVKLYDGANAIDSGLLSATSLPDAARGFIVNSILRLSYAPGDTWDEWRSLLAVQDDSWGTNTASVGPWGFNGAKWDRLRTYGVGILKVGRAEIDSTTIRHTAAGPVAAGSRKLFWVACSPDSPSAEWELSDDTDGLSATVYDHFDSDKHSEHLVFDPPMKFSNGIYIKKFDHMHSLVFCYI